MRKACVLSVGVLFFSACGAAGLPEETVGLQEMMHNGKTLYFERPLSAEVHMFEREAVIRYAGCEVKITPQMPVHGGSLERAEREGMHYSSLFDGNDVLVAYFAERPEYDLYIAAQGQESSSCIDLVGQTARSLTDAPMYYSAEHDFKVALLQGYVFDYFENGIALKRWVQPEKPSNFNRLDKYARQRLEPYEVQMSAKALPKSEEEDLGAFVAAKYPGYSVQFVQNGEVSGVYIDEVQSENDTAMRHFFTFGNGKALYEAVLTVPSVHFDAYSGVFDELVRSIEFF